MTEVMFKEHDFVVRLYTLERSRLIQTSLPPPEGKTSFSEECARYRDFIHVHSFMYDFHLRLLLDLLNKNRSSPDGFQLREFLELCYTHNSPPPNFIRNLLKKGRPLPHVTMVTQC